MKTLDCKQGSPEWVKARLGIVTASEMDALVSPIGKIRSGQGVETYLCRKICEKLFGTPVGGGGSFATEQGSILELEARPWYSFDLNIDVQTPGFCLSDDGRVGCSPDGLVGDDGGLEIKCFQPEHSLAVLMKNEVPDEYVIQIQTSLFVTKRKWWDFLSYSRQFPAVVIRVQPNPTIQESIARATKAFNERFDEMLAKIDSLKASENAIKNAAYYAKEGITP